MTEKGYMLDAYANYFIEYPLFKVTLQISVLSY